MLALVSCLPSVPHVARRMADSQVVYVQSQQIVNPIERPNVVNVDRSCVVNRLVTQRTHWDQPAASIDGRQCGPPNRLSPEL